MWLSETKLFDIGRNCHFFGTVKKFQQDWLEPDFKEHRERRQGCCLWILHQWHHPNKREGLFYDKNLSKYPPSPKWETRDKLRNYKWTKCDMFD